MAPAPTDHTEFPQPGADGSGSFRFFMLAHRIRSVSVTLLLFAAAGLVIAVSAALGAETKPAKDVSANGGKGHPLHLAIVDARKASPERDAQHRLLLASLTAAANAAAAGDAIVIGSACMSTSEAKARFLSGESTAVLVLGDERPFSLRRLAATTQCGVLEPEWGVHPVYLIVSTEPDGAQTLLTRAFNRMLGDRAALRAIVAAGNGGAVAVAQ